MWTKELLRLSARNLNLGSATPKQLLSVILSLDVQLLTSRNPGAKSSSSTCETLSKDVAHSVNLCDFLLPQALYSSFIPSSPGVSFLKTRDHFLSLHALYLSIHFPVSFMWFPPFWECFPMSTNCCFPTFRHPASLATLEKLVCWVELVHLAVMCFNTTLNDPLNDHNFKASPN